MSDRQNTRAVLGRALDLLYGICGGLAAFFLAAIALLILTQIVARLLGFFIPAASDFAGFCLAATSFLALAYTFRAGSHIRVTLVLQRIPKRARRTCDLAALGVGAALVTYFAWHSILLARESWLYNDLSFLFELPASGSYVGRSTIRGRPTHHLAFRNDAMDWQLWVDAEEPPLLRKVVLVYKNLPGAPAQVAELDGWEVPDAIADEEFRFEPPPGSCEIPVRTRRPQEGGDR